MKPILLTAFTVFSLWQYSDAQKQNYDILVHLTTIIEAEAIIESNSVYENQNYNLNIKINQSNEDSLKIDEACADKNWYISPRLGFSFFTGHFGIEGQYKYFALTFGLIEWDSKDNYIYCCGSKCYFNKCNNSWYLGISYIENLESTTPYNGNNYFTNTEKGLGGLIGFRVRWNSGFELSLGFGYMKIYGKERNVNYEKLDSGDIEKSISVSRNSSFYFPWELTVGYAF